MEDAWFQTAFGPLPGHGLGRGWWWGAVPFPGLRRRDTYSSTEARGAEGAPRDERRRQAASSPDGLACASELLGLAADPWTSPCSFHSLSREGARGQGGQTPVPINSFLRNRNFHVLCSCVCVCSSPRGHERRREPLRTLTSRSAASFRREVRAVPCPVPPPAPACPASPSP